MKKYLQRHLKLLGVDWGKSLPVPRFDTSTMSEVKNWKERICIIKCGHLQIKVKHLNLIKSLKENLHLTTVVNIRSN